MSSEFDFLDGRRPRRWVSTPKIVFYCSTRMFPFLLSSVNGVKRAEYGTVWVRAQILVIIIIIMSIQRSENSQRDGRSREGKHEENTFSPLPPSALHFYLAPASSNMNNETTGNTATHRHAWHGLTICTDSQSNEDTLGSSLRPERHTAERAAQK